VGVPELKFQARETAELVAYLRTHPLVSDVLFTGGDPLIMKTEVLRRYVDPLLDPSLSTVQTIRLGTKSLAYWPQRFTTDDDAEDLLRLIETVVNSGRHFAVMAHCSHPMELDTPLAREAVRRLRSAGAELRMQAPLVRHVNDHPGAWAEMWRLGVRLGMVPYYMFVERDTGPRNYFEVPLSRAHQIFRQAYRRVSGLARTVRGPSMSAWPGKVRILGTGQVAGEEVFVLDFLQARDPAWVRKPFFARFDAEATWLDQLEPPSWEDRFFFDEEGALARDARHELPEWAAELHARAV
jgi:L-lysine 2,3-aminomutase